MGPWSKIRARLIWGNCLLFVLLLPLFLLSGLGFAAVKKRILRPDWVAGVGELTAKLLIPALLFGGSYKNGLPPAVSWQVLCAFYAPLVLLFLLALVLARANDAPQTALAATYSNTVFVGVPVLVQALGEDSLQFAFPVIAFHSLIAFTLYYLGAATGGSGRRLATSLTTACKNPIVLSLMLGLLLKTLGVVLPATLMHVLAMLAGAALPCALLVLGASLASLRVQSWLRAIAVTGCKLLLFPALVWLLAVHVMHLGAAVSAALVLLASCPVGVNAALVVQADGKDAGVVSSAILLSSALCMASMPFWLWVLGRG